MKCLGQKYFLSDCFSQERQEGVCEHVDDDGSKFKHKLLILKLDH